MKGERLGEGVQVHGLTPSPQPSPSRERELSDRLQGGFLSFQKRECLIRVFEKRVDVRSSTLKTLAGDGKGVVP
jgi:hypothetical protein